MLNFNEANVNIYLQSISSNQYAIQAFANDMAVNFVNCFQTRFIMLPNDINSLNSWPDALKQQITLMVQSAATLHGMYSSNPLLWSVSGFEDPSGTPALPSAVEGEVEIKTKTNTTTGQTDIEVRAKVTFPIC